MDTPGPELHLMSDESAITAVRPGSIIQLPDEWTRTITSAIGNWFARLTAGLLDVVTFIGATVEESFAQIILLRVVCLKYGWCLTPDFSFGALLTTAVAVNSSARPQHAIYVALRDYFSAENWQELENLIAAMSPFMGGKRKKILRDCVIALRMHGVNRFNAANLVVHTCVNLLDGMLGDFAHELGIVNWHDRKSGGFARLRGAIESVSHSYDHPAVNLIFETLYSQAFYGKIPKSGRHFNRHRIGHGNWLEYGRIEYVLRLFLMIRFIDYIVEEYRMRKLAGSDVPTTMASKYSKILSENPLQPAREAMRARIERRYGHLYIQASGSRKHGHNERSS